MPQLSKSTASACAAPGRGGFWGLLCLALVLGALFSRSFQGPEVLFSSDGPLGANLPRYMAMPEGYGGVWADIYWVGKAAGSAFPNLSHLLLWVLKPVGFAKFYAPIALLVLGLSVWLCFRRLGFRPWVCALGGVAAALNTDFFSYACWGLGTLTLTVAAMFLGLAALVAPGIRSGWAKAALAGVAVGLGIMEGFDSGAILSLFFAAFVVFQSWQDGGGPWRRVGRGAGRLALVAVVAGLVAARALTVLVGTQIQGVVGMQQDQPSKAERWNEATIWSLPKLETLRIVIPGLFGYRMDTANGGNYWGAVGQQPGAIQTRHSGSGVYAGVLVVIVAFWAMLQSLRRAGKVFEPAERRIIWFWSGALLVSLLLAWGRHAPFYQLVYALPYFSTIRNPIKFMHPFHVALVILFGYGLQGLARSCLEKPLASAGSLRDQLKAWWATVRGFDRRWVVGSAVAVVASLVGWLLYLASRGDLEAFLKQAVPPGDLAPAIVRFSLLEVGWFILFLAVTVGVLTLMFSGALAGRRARWAALFAGVLLVADLSRANVPWVVYFNHRDRYALNPVLEALRAQPHERRVVMFPFRLPDQLGGGQQLLGFLQQYYHAEWIQHQFPANNIASLDVVQEPRPAADDAAYRAALFGAGAAGWTRLLELTSTRLVFGLGGGFLDFLNQQFDSGRKRFRLRTPFTFTQERGGAILVQTNAEGPFALLEFTGALPRAGLYSRWMVRTDLTETLRTLAEPGFDPARTVLVASPLPPGTAAAATNVAGGKVEWVGYAPRQIEFETTAAAPSVLLLNDKFNPDWRVRVDGAEQPLLRCNFLMRGVFVPPGRHRVEFRYRTPLGTLYASLAGLALGGVLLAFAAWERRRAGRPAANPTLHPPPGGQGSRHA